MGLYGMHSEDGNDQVDMMVVTLVAQAREHGWTAKHTFDIAVGCLDEMADRPGTDEAFDTVVRDSVWEQIKLELDPA